jgi:hypothetical protein
MARLRIPVAERRSDAGDQTPAARPPEGDAMRLTTIRERVIDLTIWTLIQGVTSPGRRHGINRKGWAMYRRIRMFVAAAAAGGLTTAVALPVLTESAYAKGKPAVVTLACPTGESASGTVTLLSSIFGSPASNATPVSCVSGQTSKVSIHPTSQPAAAFTYSIGVSGTQNGGCGGNATRGGGTIDCFAGVTLSVT